MGHHSRGTIRVCDKPPRTSSTRWLDLAESDIDLATDPAATKLITTRERQIKGGRARLVNQAALDRWSGRSGLSRLDYRWSVARRHLQRPLRREVGRVTLTPETRVLLTDALRPPAGYRVEVAVGTTYSLNLTALLLAPLSFALCCETPRVDATTPRTSAHSIRSGCSRRSVGTPTTPRCSVRRAASTCRRKYRSILTFVEDSVREVMPSRDDALFHPKIWALRFVDQDQNRLHRVIVLSRNLTLDRSWDTALVLDEQDDGTIDAAPAAEFVRRLPSLGPSAADTEASRRDSATSRPRSNRSRSPHLRHSPTASSSRSASTSTNAWPFPDRRRRLLAISPFLTQNAVASVVARSPTTARWSRAPNRSSRSGSAALHGWDVNVLQRLAEVDPGEDIDDVSNAVPDGFFESHDGLHAKTFVIDVDRNQSMIVTGSANLTTASWSSQRRVRRRPHRTHRLMRRRPPSCKGRPKRRASAKFSRSTRSAAQDGIADEAATTAFTLEAFHRRLAAGQPVPSR